MGAIWPTGLAVKSCYHSNKCDLVATWAIGLFMLL